MQLAGRLKEGSSVQIQVSHQRDWISEFARFSRASFRMLERHHCNPFAIISIAGALFNLGFLETSVASQIVVPGCP